MADGQKKSEWGETLLGFVIIVIGIAAIGGAGYLLYSKFSSSGPGQLSLSAYFVDESGAPAKEDSPNYEQSHLKIRGDVYQGDQPVKSGNVRLTLRTADERFRQSVSVPLKDGRFETEDPAFITIRPGAEIQITADVSSSQPSLVLTERIDLNSAAPSSTLVLKIGLGVGFLVLSGIFFYSFTGKKTHLKNRTAIIFSYVIIGVFLAVPILAPVFFFQVFTDPVKQVGGPVGLVNTRTAIQEGDQSEWALNIGGYSYVPPDAVPVVPDNTASTGSAPASNPTTPRVATPTTSGTVLTAGAKPSPGNPQHAAQPNTDAQPASTAASGGNSPETAALRPRSSRGARSNPTVVKVEGGLVIPLYVIILSVIGGAINMTRKVPGFQKEGEESDFSIVRPISSLGTAVMNGIVNRGGEAATAAPLTAADATHVATDDKVDDQEKKSEPPLQDQAATVDGLIDPLVVEQIKRNCETEIAVTKIGSLVLRMRELFKSKPPDERLLKFNSFEDWFGSHPRLREVLGSNWRVELLNQYMYLISAPFLAIVTYYIIDLLGLTKLGRGVLVVLSFSVGLISEKIVTWILGIASGYLRTDSTSNPAKAA
jgi:hypothetical protein